MSYAGVSALTAGQFLALRSPVGAPVELVVGGRVVAHGELIEIQGELGVRIGGIAR